AVTFDGVRLRLVVGGTIADELRSGLGLRATGTTLYVGSPSTTEPALVGRIDELAIYDYELLLTSLTERAALLRAVLYCPARRRRGVRLKGSRSGAIRSAASPVVSSATRSARIARARTHN